MCPLITGPFGQAGCPPSPKTIHMTKYKTREIREVTFGGNSWETDDAAVDLGTNGNIMFLRF